MYFAAAGTRKHAFTLVEMLIVTSIVGLLLALVVPVTNGVVQANQITTASQIVVDQLNLARQTAIARNRVVELRFYQCRSASRQPQADEVAALQALVFDARNEVSTPLREVQWLPGAAVISSNATLSTVFASGMEKANWTNGDPKRPLPGLLGGDGTNYKAFSVYFRPDGSTNLATQSSGSSWWVSLHGVNETAEVPANIISVQINPFNGTLNLHRPG